MFKNIISKILKIRRSPFFYNGKEYREVIIVPDEKDPSRNITIVVMRASPISVTIGINAPKDMEIKTLVE